MRKDGTHTEMELEELDRRLSEIWVELNDLVAAHEKDDVGLSFAYARPKNKGRDDEQTMYGVCVAGYGGAMVAALAELFGKYPELLMGVLERVAEKHPEKLRMQAASRPNDKRTLS